MKKVLSLLLIATMIFRPAFALDVSYERAMNKIVSGVVDTKAIAMGATATQRASTMSAMSAALTANAGKLAAGAVTAAGVTLAAITSPAWIAQALVLTAGGVVMNYLFNKYVVGSDGQVTVGGGTGGSTVQANQPKYWSTSVDWGQYGICGSGESCAALNIQFKIRSGQCFGGNYGTVSGSFSNGSDGNVVGYSGAAQNENGSWCYGAASYGPISTGVTITNCSAGQYFNLSTASCTSGSTTNVSQPAQSQKMTTEQAYAQMTPAEKATPLTATELAPLIDQIWRTAAAQPGYQGVPYSYSNPVSTSDVSAWQQANPSVQPTVGDLFQPQTNATSTDVSTNPWSMTSPTAQTQPTSPTSPTSPNQPTVNLDLGPNPNIGEPGIPEPPTGQQILQPLLDIVNPFKNINLNNAGQCPTYTLDVLGHHYVMDTHCTIFAQHESAIRAVMTAVFGISAVIILLGA
jgi:hypothetical protein